MRIRRTLHSGGASWPEAEVTGIDYWGAVYNYSRAMCESNARSEGVSEQCRFLHGDAGSWTFQMKLLTLW